ncbi:hypothetical protein GCM10010507_19820 [Streptomyces cinnamoneus]|uniref:DUF5131 domain-containing protein n=2 Tax=Streptomyces cinnamoneus TaxID=53446 RepID=A0A918TG91_STRCJ|nr:hypothetical protein GCM10010507_19820 [Streptomyces cinnamoneus]
MGVSVENAEELGRVAVLRTVPAAVRFLSLEPLLGPLTGLELDGMGWVIVGGESGPGHRPMEQDWVIQIRDACRAAGVPFFFKQPHRPGFGRPGRSARRTGLRTTRALCPCGSGTGGAPATSTTRNSGCSR